jgi:acetolactate synthase-1/2/3 large subunit
MWNIEELERSLVLAFQIAKSGKPGPVVVDICSDVFTRTTNLSVTLATNASLFRNPRMSAKKAMEIIATLQQAKRPVVLAGGGVNNTEASVLLRTFVDKFKLPTTLTFMGLGALAFNHPLFLGMPGMHGTRAANIALTEADCILIIGARLDNRVALNGFADGKTIIHVDIASEEIHKIIVAQLGLVTSASEFLAFANSVVARDRDGADEWIRHTSDLKTQHAQQDSFISSSHPFVRR